MPMHPELLALDLQHFEALSPEERAQVFNGSGGTGLEGTLAQRLGIRFVRVTREEVVARLPVEGNRQPFGRLHGGANLALAEELASFGSWLNIDPQRQVAVGVDLSATHVRGVTEGEVTGEARLAYQGRSVLVWTVELKDERGRVTSLARCTCHVTTLGA